MARLQSIVFASFGLLAAALPLAGCDVPAKRTVKYWWASEMQFDIGDGERTQLGQAITPWHINLGSGDMWLNGAIRGSKTQREVMPTALKFEFLRYNSIGTQVLDNFSYDVPVKRNGKFKLKKSPFAGFEFQMYEQFEMFVTPMGGDILDESEFSLCQNYRRLSPVVR
jgi:hypothetical protein